MRKNHLLYPLCFTVTMLAAAPVQLMAASNAQMEACKIAALNTPKLHDYPMAALSVRPGKKENHVGFTLKWDGASGKGYCRVTPDGVVKEVKLNKFHGAGSASHPNNNGEYMEQDGFFRDGSGRWRDPSGEVCHSCTPENGFPAAGNHGSNGSEEMDGFYFDRHIGQWRDPDGYICHTCTPENGFPDH